MSRSVTSSFSRVNQRALKLHAPFGMIIAGPSRCGKTTFVYHLLKNASRVMNKPPGKVIFFYNQWQPLLAAMVRERLVHRALPQLPSVSDVQEHIRPRENGLVIVDDFMREANSDIGYMFTALSHHHNVSVVFLSQNLFSQHGPFRDMSLSATYLVYFKNPRDGSQIWHFARQFRPDNPAYVVHGYRSATQAPYSYVLFDLHQQTPDYLRMRTRIFPHEGRTVIIVPHGRGPKAGPATRAISAGT